MKDFEIVTKNKAFKIVYASEISIYINRRQPLFYSTFKYYEKKNDRKIPFLF
jgi:hypothetical protein